MAIIIRILYWCWEALMTLLEFFGYLNDNPEQPLFRHFSSPRLPPRTHSRNANLFTSEDDTYYNHELSPPEAGVFLDHMVQSPIQHSPAFRFASLLMPPKDHVADFSTEILLEIFRYLAVVDQSDEETASPLVLERLRLVCRRWRAIVDTHCRGRFLTATPGFLVHDREDELPTWSRQFDAWSKIDDTRPALDIVSFYLCNRFASSWYTLNVDHARIFTRALMKCKTARIVVDLTEAELNTDFFTGTTSPTIPLRDFSWTSEHMGIRHTLPEIYRFPWLTLWRDLPWQQLTHVDLNCPLSLWDAHHVLAHGVNLTDARLATLKMADQVGMPPHPTSMPLLRSLTIHSLIDLHLLFSNLKLPKLTYVSLSAVHPIFRDVEPNLDIFLNIPWAQIEQLAIRYESDRKCDVAPILSACSRLRRLALAGNLTIRGVTNSVRCLDKFTLDADVLWRQSCNTWKDTTIKKMQISRASSLGPLRYLRDFGAIDELSITNPINLEFLLGVLGNVPSFNVGNFQVSSVSLRALADPEVPTPDLLRLDDTTREELIQLVSEPLKYQTIPVCIIPVDE